jgi:archaeal cell division control protein 6
MVQQKTAELTNIFSQYLQKESIFKDKKALTSSFVPEKIQHRDNEIRQIGAVLAPVLRGYHPNNIFIYGTCGTGKTIVVKFIINQLTEAVNGNGHRMKVVYINCKMKKVADTEYRLFAQLLKEFGECVPDTGLPTDVLYRKFFERVEALKGNVIIILDEIDTLVKKIGDEFLYNFTRINNDLQQSHVTVVGITNDLGMRDNLDMRVKSSLSEEEILFKPYDAAQLKEILSERTVHGFQQGAVEEPVLNKCAALAAQEHGDARRALDLLRVAGELAERLGVTNISEDHVDMAEGKIDLDRVSETIKAQPSQSQAVLYSIIKLQEKTSGQKKWVDSRLLTGDVFDGYQAICKNNGMKPLTQRRVSDLIGELDMLGIITAKVISNGRYGRTREIKLAMNDTVLQKTNAYLAEKFGA